MKALANLSIRAKLIGFILVATTVPLVSGFGLVIYKSIRSFEETLVENTEVIARVVAGGSAFWVWTDDPENAQKDLERALERIAFITDAYIYIAPGQAASGGEPFAAYSRSPTVNPPPEIHPVDIDLDYHEIRGNHLHYFAPVVREDEREGTKELLGTLFLRATKEPYDAQVRGYLLYMTGLTLALVGVAALLAYLLQGVISKPILDLAALAQRVSSEADYSVRVPPPGRDEIGILYDGFNEMLAQIQRRQQELERSNRDLDQFAHVASHDLKAPLRAITTLSAWIEEDLKDRLTPETAEQMQLLRHRVRRMDELIDGILQYSRAGRMDSRGEPVDVAQLVAGVIELIDPPEGFRVVVGPGMPTLITKRLRLQQVFSNLITNAIKYHDRRDGRVKVTAQRQGEYYEFAVTDDGPGIAQEHHDRIFMMFQTLQPGDETRSTGLGLSLVKKLVEEEGGRVRLESEVGSGSTFRFTWPAVHDISSSEDEGS